MYSSALTMFTHLFSSAHHTHQYYEQQRQQPEIDHKMYMEWCWFLVWGDGIHFVKFLPRETAFMTSCLLSWTPSPSEKETTLKGKNLLPFRVNPFSEGRQIILIELPLLKVYPFPLCNICCHSLRIIIINFNWQQLVQEKRSGRKRWRL